MSLTRYLPLLLILGVARAHAQESEHPGQRPGLTAAAVAAAMAAEPDPPRLGLKPLRAPALPGSAPLRSRAVPPPTLRHLLSRYPASAVAVADTPVAPSGDPGQDTPSGPRGFLDLELPEVVQQAADLGLRVEGRGGVGGAWNQYRPCDTALRLSCQPGLIPQLRPDIEFGIQVGGTIADRVHVNVDYDQRREFDTANNISVYYQGAPGEVLQRFEMGDVSIGLPPSRYLTQGIPAGNFGFKAAAQVGATAVEAVWAQQRGEISSREFRLGGLGRQGLVQEQERVLDDSDYAAGQFFFLLDPTHIAGYPHIDVLTLARGDAPAQHRPQPERLVIFRDEGVISTYAEQARSGKFLADAVSADGVRRHSGLFRLLEPGVDYYIHPSGLWVALRAPLRDDEALAAGYATETGVLMGDPEPEARPPGVTPELLLVRAPAATHQPGQPTWGWEMHQVYRLDSSAEVELSTLDLVISLGHQAGGITFKEFAGGKIPLLRLFGLDGHAPADRIDEARVFRPGTELGGLGMAALRGTFIVFPTLEPFWRPPPVPAEGLSAAETAAILGADANQVIYDAVDPVVRRGGSRFRLNFRYRVEMEGLLSSFNLGAFGIRPGTERITVDDRLLVRGVDYVLDYDIGLVTLLDPQVTLGTNPDAEIRATWEQQPLFEVAPTTVMGLHARTPLGAYGDLSLVGLYQAEQAMLRRPQLGMAPRAVMMGGLSGRLAFQADWLARALQAVPFLSADSVARLDVTGELAMSAPDPNRRGGTYLDDFEATDEIALSLEAWEWRLGSAPQDPAGIPQLAWPPTPRNAASLVWQDRYLEGGREAGFLTAQEIDQQISIAGARVAERVLYLTMAGRQPPDPPPHWRSITTVLSTTGRDLSRSEFLEFYAAPWDPTMEGALLVIDIGTVSEDAFYFDQDLQLSGVDALGRPWGQGILDEEASLANREVWGPDHDRLGLWGQACEADRLNPVPLGDPRANCTVNNGRRDTEDLNGNGVLDVMDGPAFRYVIPLSGTSSFLVRDQPATGTAFRLFRVPLRGPNAIPMHGASEATWRFIQHMRVTVVKPRQGQGTLALARFRIAGSRWTKRDEYGVVGGLTGDLPGAGAGLTAVRVGPVSRLTDGAGYASPPGVEDETQDPRAGLGPSGVEFNEKGLRLSWERLLGGERAEVYFRYPQQPRSFLDYRQIRFWAVPRSGDWGEGGDHRVLMKVGTDARNYYLYQTPLQPVQSAAGVAREDWLPERAVDFDEWFVLKAEAERILTESPGSGPLVLWNEDLTYGLVLEDRARAPNLAAVRELTFAVYNASTGETSGEVWLNDVRLHAAARDMGAAGRVGVDLAAGGVLTASAVFSNRGGRFRQLNDVASYETRDELTVNATAELGRFAPAEWGVSMPVTMSYLRTGLDPLFLQGTDIPADRLPGLRETGMSRRRVGLTLRRTAASDHPLMAALVDGTTLRVSHLTTSDNSVTTASRLDAVEAGIEVDRPVANLDVGLVPAPIQDALRWLAPRRLEESAFFGRITGARLRFTPERIALSAGYLGQEFRVWRYDRVLQSPRDLDIVPLESPRRALETGARIAFRPLESVTARVGVTTGRDILDPERATPLALEQQALRRATQQVAGMGMGWERDRVVASDAAVRPVVADWLRPSMSWTSRFGQRRDPAHMAVTEGAGGPEARLQRTFHTDSRWTRGLVLDPHGALRAIAGMPDPPPPGDPEDRSPEDGSPEDGGPEDGGLPAQGPAAGGGVARVLLALLQPLRPIEVSWTEAVGSRFDRQLVHPGVGYQLGLGRLDGVRVIDGDTAAAAVRQETFRARSGVRLGPGIDLGLAYSEGEGRAFDRWVGRREQADRSWPDVQLNLREMPVPAVLVPVLTRWSVSTGFVRSERSTVLRGNVDRVWARTEATVPLEVRLGFASGLALAYVTAVTNGDGRDPTGLTERTGVTHGVDLSGRFRAPLGLAETTFPEPLRLSLAFDSSSEHECRTPSPSAAAAGGDCTPLVDHVSRRVHLTLSTLVSQLDLGLQGSYIDRRSFIGTQVGSSQLQLGIYGQFNMQAGNLGPR
jgi:hypothetical protein